MFDLLPRNGRWTAVTELDSDLEDTGDMEGYGDTPEAAIADCLSEAEAQERALADEHEVE